MPADLSAYSDQELAAMAQPEAPPSPPPDLAAYSDAELEAMAAPSAPEKALADYTDEELVQMAGGETPATWKDVAKEVLRRSGAVVLNPLVEALPQNARNSIKQGVVDQGAGSTAEATVRTVGQGAAGLIAGAQDTTARLGIGAAGARDWQIRQLETESEQMWAVHDRRGQPFDDAQRARLAEIDAALAPLYADQQQQTAGSFATALAGEAQAMAGKVGQLRADYRAATPVEQKFAKGLPGQLLSGAGQLGFSFAANAVGLGLPAAMAQSADQQYQDAKQAGAGEEQAMLASLQALPLGAIDQLGDKISIGPLLKALRPQGETVVRQTLARELLKRAGRATGAGLIEGGTEYVQQVGQNALARPYDPERPLAQGANTAATVGFLLGTGAHGLGQLAETRSTPSPAESAGTPTAPNLPAGGSTGETLPGALDPAIWDPRGSVLDAQGQFTPEPAGAPNPGANLPPATIAPATTANLNSNPPGRSAPDVAQAPVFQYTPSPQLTAEERGVEQRFAQAIAEDPGAAIAAYRARNTNQGLLTINPDEARELSPDYAADKTSRGRYAPAVHEPASALAKMVYAQALAEPARTGNVLFLAGGGGSGKGSALKNAGIPAANYDIAYDGTFANGSSSAARIDQALNSGRKVDIVFIYRPQEQAWQGVEQRRLKNGRSVPYATFKNAHQNALANVLELKELYAGNQQVNFLFLDNSGRPDEIKAVSSPEIVRRLGNDGALNQARAAEITASEERKHAGNQNGIHAPDGATPGQALGGDRAESQPGGRAPAPSRAGRGAQRGAALQTGQFDRGGDSSGGTGGSGPLGFTAKLPGGGAEVRGAWRVVEAGSIVTSQDQGYAAELQPRDRRRGASEQQVAKIAAGLDPELLGNSVTTDLGAPMVDGAQQVLSGNGRMLAIRDAYAAGESGRGGVYKQWLAAHADEFGLTTAEVQALQQPVLVRQIDDFGGLTPPEFARQSNQRQVLGMSEAEQATADAMRLRETPALLGKFAPGQDGDLLAASNREFLNDFIESTGDRAELIDSTGMGYSPRLASRVRQAVLAAVIGPEHRALLNQLIEVPEGLRKVVNSLLASAPRLLHYRGTPYDLGSALAQGLGDFISAKRAGVAIDDHLGQIDAFSGSLRTPASDLLARTFDELKHANRITDFLASYDRMAAQQDTTTGDMFGQAPATPMELLIRARTEAQGGGETQAQFARRKAAATAPDKSQTDMFTGGQTGGDTLFALQGEAIDATLAAWNMDDALATREATRQQARAQGAFEFATRTPEQAARGNLDSEQGAKSASKPMASGDGAAQQSSGSPQSGPDSAEVINPKTYVTSKGTTLVFSAGGSNYASRDIATAGAYAHNPGFGGDGEIYAAPVELRTIYRVDSFRKLAQQAGLDYDSISSSFDRGEYQTLDRPEVRQWLLDEGYDAVQYSDDFPDGADVLFLVQRPDWKSTTIDRTRVLADVIDEHAYGVSRNSIRSQAIDALLAAEEEKFGRKIAWKNRQKIRTLLDELSNSHLAEIFRANDIVGESRAWRLAVAVSKYNGFSDDISSAREALGKDPLTEIQRVSKRENYSDTDVKELFQDAAVDPEYSRAGNGASDRGSDSAATSFATRTPEQAAVIRTRLEQLQALWMARAQRLAPGVMSAFKLAFGSPEQLVRMGRAQARSLTGYEEAAYLAHERMLFLFDRALQSNGDSMTLTNLLHEMGHAHWDTLPQARQLDLLALWREELPQIDARGRQTRGGQGPLYGKDGRLRPGVALGVEQSVKEWYAERVAWANQQWAQARMGGMTAPGAGLIGRMAQQFRAVLARLAEFIARLRGDEVTRDFRRFLAHGAPWAQGPTTWAPGAPAGAWVRRSPAQVLEDQKNDFRSWLRRNFTSAGGMPDAAFAALQRRDARLGAIHQEMRFALRDLDRALHAVYGGYAAMTEAQTRQVNDALAGASPLTGLDPRLRVPVTLLRQHIDVLSRRLIREGVVSGDLAAKVGANVGLYLNRSYRKFDEPKWARQVPEPVLQRARSFIAAELQAKNPLLPVDPAAVEGYVRYLLGKDVTETGDFYRAPDKKGAMDLRIFTARKDIAPEIRELMGEYHDPRVNYLRSVAKMAQVLESHQYLAEIRALGLRAGWLHTEPRYDATGSYTVQVAGKGSHALKPLAGLYTTAEIAQAFNDTFSEAGLVMQWWRRANALAKIAKTVWSPMTQARNFAGNIGFLVANGHWRIMAAGDVWQALRADFGWGDTPQRRAYYARLVRLGIVGEDVTSGEIKEAIHDVGPRMGDLERWTDSRMARAAKLPAAAAARLYHLNDEVFKIYAFENERRAWAAADPSLTPEQVDAIAAERVRNTLPTYSLISRAVVTARRYGLTGSFMSFPAEIVRTGYHTLNYAVTDLRSQNPKIRAMGAKRLAGLAIVASLPAAASMLTRWLVGYDAEDEKDLRRFLPDWVKNAMLYYQGHDGKGRISLIDASYLDPWNYLKKPLTAALQGKDWQQALVNASLEAMDPFVGEGLVTKVGLDLARNVDANGRQIWNPALPFLERTQQQLAHAWRAFEPGILTQGGRIVKAARGIQEPTGRVYELKNELLAVATGARSQSLDVGQALIFKAKHYAGELAQANRIFSEVRDRKGTVDPQELADAQQKSETARRALFAEMKEDYEAALRLGVGKGEAMLALVAGAGKEQAKLISAGVYEPYQGQQNLRRQALEQTVLQR